MWKVFCDWKGSTIAQDSQAVPQIRCIADLLGFCNYIHKNVYGVYKNEITQYIIVSMFPLEFDLAIN